MEEETIRVRLEDGQTATSDVTWKRTKNDFFLLKGGITIAKRGRPGSRHAGKWISLKSEYVVIDDPETGDILIGQATAPDALKHLMSRQS